MLNPPEPYITINDVHLTEGQAMAVRVAIARFMLELEDPRYVQALGEIGPLYKARLVEVTNVMLRSATSPAR